MSLASVEESVPIRQKARPMRLPRFRIRTLMIAVAVAALAYCIADLLIRCAMSLPLDMVRFVVYWAGFLFTVSLMCTLSIHAIKILFVIVTANPPAGPRSTPLATVAGLLVVAAPAGVVISWVFCPSIVAVMASSH